MQNGKSLTRIKSWTRKMSFPRDHSAGFSLTWLTWHWQRACNYTETSLNRANVRPRNPIMNGQDFMMADISFKSTWGTVPNWTMTLTNFTQITKIFFLSILSGSRQKSKTFSPVFRTSSIFIIFTFFLQGKINFRISLPLLNYKLREKSVTTNMNS